MAIFRHMSPLRQQAAPSSVSLLAVAIALLAVIATGCYNNNTGETTIGGGINFTLPAFPETGSNAVQVFTEMHYQPSYRIQEGPRLLPPADSVPVTGKELRYTDIDEYRALSIPADVVSRYDPQKGQELFTINCAVCHGDSLTGDGRILGFWPRNPETGVLKGPTPADLTLDATRTSSDGEIFGFISRGGSQGLSLRLRGRESTSPMPEFGLLLTEEERWALVVYLRSRIGGP